MNDMTNVERHFRIKLIDERLASIKDEIQGIQFAMPTTVDQVVFDRMEFAIRELDTARQHLKAVPTLTGLESMLAMSLDSIAETAQRSRDRRRCQDVAEARDNVHPFPTGA